MEYRVQDTTRFWYSSDIAYAASLWNNSSYKGTSTSFTFDDDGNTNAPTDYPDLNNVIGIGNLPSSIAALSHTYWYPSTGELYECDIVINSIAVLNIQPHHLAGPGDLCVMNALAHEFGHALGLSHLDKNSVGNWIEYIADTMYFDISPGEHKKHEGLECDDKWGIWITYDSGSIDPPNAPSAVDYLQSTEFQESEDGAIPTITKLVGNYPNPFNPETWIAYTLADDSKVDIRIYDVDGQIVRLLPLGNKSKGMYVEKESAAYWDGKTDAGQPVSSGVYFYSLVTDTSSYTKRMAILK